MGEIAEMMLDGTMCQGCGEWLCDGEDGPGFPGFCEACKPRVEPRRKPTPNASPKTVKCPSCRKRFWTKESMRQHRTAAHED